QTLEEGVENPVLGLASGLRWIHRLDFAVVIEREVGWRQCAERNGPDERHNGHGRGQEEKSSANSPDHVRTSS
ncbi:MAG: hypothetical protein RLZ64_1598, partial [Pseudomonadota bacterium]